MNRSDRYNKTAIARAFGNNNVSMVEKLLDNQANRNMIRCDSTQYTTILSVSHGGNLSMMKLLLNEKNHYKFAFDWVCAKYICVMHREYVVVVCICWSFAMRFYIVQKFLEKFFNKILRHFRKNFT